MAQSNKQRRERIKRKLLERCRPKCSECGYERSISALCFHHRKPEDIHFNVSGTRLTKIAYAELEAEVDKCIVLCLNCHAEPHDREGWIHEDGKRKSG